MGTLCIALVWARGVWLREVVGPKTVASYRSAFLTTSHWVSVPKDANIARTRCIARG
jgi:hypothetical protein